MILEKVYDELIGMIEDLQKKIGSGGSTVTITPTLESGQKLADYSIDGTEGAIYGPSVPDVRIYPAVDFVFDNSTTALVSVSDISADLANAVCIIGFAGTAGTAVQIVRSGNKESISAIVGSAITVTLPINIVAFYSPTTGRTKTTKKK